MSGTGDDMTDKQIDALYEEKCEHCGAVMPCTRRLCALKRREAVADASAEKALAPHRDTEEERLAERRALVSEKRAELIAAGVRPEHLVSYDVPVAGQVLVRMPDKALFKEFVDEGFLKPKAEMSTLKYEQLYARCSAEPPKSEALKFMNEFNPAGSFAIGGKILDWMMGVRAAEGKG